MGIDDIPFRREENLFTDRAGRIRVGSREYRRARKGLRTKLFHRCCQKFFQNVLVKYVERLIIQTTIILFYLFSFEMEYPSLRIV